MQLADAFDTDGITNKNIENAPYRWMGLFRINHRFIRNIKRIVDK